MNVRLIAGAMLSAVLLVGCTDRDQPHSDTSSPPHKCSESLAYYDPGGHPVRTEAKVDGTLVHAEHDESEIYQTSRCDTDGYTLRIPNGTYHVRLSFSEHQHDAAGKRVFGVAVQGQQIVERLDVFALAGKNTAYRLQSPDMIVTDGLLRIQFRRIVDVPCVAFISIGGDIAGAERAIDRMFFQHIDCGRSKTEC
jgi:major membrane immunogen (membrane-anchored lipoprotein)